MKLLVDQNLSRNLVGRLRDYFPDSAHVTTLGLETATVLKVLIDHYEVIEAFENAAEEALLLLPGLPRE